jgi:hypothetical protein
LYCFVANCVEAFCLIDSKAKIRTTISEIAGAATKIRAINRFINEISDCVVLAKFIKVNGFFSISNKINNTKRKLCKK